MRRQTVYLLQSTNVSGSYFRNLASMITRRKERKVWAEVPSK